jgi:site-specific DNA recombinase
MSRKVKAAALYCRISEDRRGEALGVQRQAQMCEKLAKDKGWPVVASFTDNDVSAYGGRRRPEYGRMLEAIESGEIDAVVCVDLDRLTRRPSELERFIELADRHHVALANVSGDVDLSTSDGRFRARILGSVARMESEKKSERLKREREQAARAGRYHGGKRPFGYNLEGRDRLKIRPDEAKLIREASKRWLAGDSLEGIAKDWKDRGVISPTGTPFTSQRIRDVITGPTVAAIRRHQPRDRDGRIVSTTDYEATWKPILDRQTYERLQAKTKGNGTVKRGRPAARLLSGLIECGECGSRLYAASGAQGEPRYVCRADNGGCGSVGISGARTDEYVAEMVLFRLSGPGLAKALDQTTVTDSAGLADELLTLEARLDEAAEMLAVGELDRKGYGTVRARLEDEMKGIRRTLAKDAGSRPLADLPTAEAKLRHWWEGASLQRKRAVMAAVVEQITVARVGKGGAFNPDRLSVTFRV